MKQVKISEAKNNLSRYLKYVARGGRVRILDRDVPVADLVPVEPMDTADDDDRELAELARRGMIQPGEGGPLPPALLRPGPGAKDGGRAGARVLAALLDERSGGR